MAVDVPNLITESGRETLGVQDRIDLLSHDIGWLELARGGIERVVDAADKADRHRLMQGGMGSAIHDYNITIGVARDTCSLYERALQRGTTVETLQRGADRMLSELECWILAWRRGGHQEYKRTRQAQRAVKEQT